MRKRTLGILTLVLCLMILCLAGTAAEDLYEL